VTVGALMVLAASVGWSVSWLQTAKREGAPSSERRGPDGIRSAEMIVFGINALTLRVSDDLDKGILAIVDSYHAVGVYTVAYRIASYVLFPSRAVLGRFMPAVFRAGPSVTSEWRDLVRKTQKELAGMLLLTMPPLIGGALLLPLVLGQRYAASVPMAITLIPLLGLRGLHWIYGDILVAIGRIRLRLVAQCISLIIPLVAYVVLIQVMASWGAVIATGLGEVLAILCMRGIAIKAMRLDSGIDGSATAAAPIGLQV
ncbi:MAG TPA: hypothetical protein VFA16_17895, partial [Mycobacterium sp.]|uniref:lipopolysaccharide biosynthesis protein n=1 Tax=Mycobacterium sp. TaxID=1785 RepID=UPI002D706724